RQHPLGSLEHCHVDAGPGSDVREFGGDVTATDQGDARREDVELEKLLAGDCILLAGDIQRYGARTASDQDVSPLELPVALDYDRIGAGESGAPVKGVNSAFGKFLFPIAGHFIGEAALERDQAAPINLRVARNTMAAHAGLRVDRLSPTDQHLLWIAAAQCASPAEGTVINQRDRPPSSTHARACRLCGGAGADDH